MLKKPARLLMKVGDLIELSAYGKRLHCVSERRGKLGIVVAVRPAPDWGVVVDWLDTTHPEARYCHPRRDLKIAK